MTPITLARLMGITVAAVLIAGISVWMNRSSTADAARGEAFFPGLIARANELTGLRIDAGDWQAQFTRTDQGFVDASGYPVDAQAVRALLTAMATLSIEEAKTADPARHADLELAAPDAAKGAGRRIEFLVGDEPVAAMILGRRDLSVGGTSGGVYARRAQEPQSWLLRGALDLPPDRAGWFDAVLLDLPAVALRSVQLRAAQGGDAIRFEATSGQPGTLAVADGIPEPLPQDRQIDTARVTRLATIPDSLRFRDVRRADTGRPVAVTGVLETADGGRVVLDRLAAEGNDPASANWVRVRAEGGEGAEPPAWVGALSTKTAGFEFLLSPDDAALLSAQSSDWLAPASRNPS